MVSTAIIPFANNANRIIIEGLLEQLDEFLRLFVHLFLHNSDLASPSILEFLLVRNDARLETTIKKAVFFHALSSGGFDFVVHLKTSKLRWKLQASNLQLGEIGTHRPMFYQLS